tara:strand:+ start:309 stop:533 length:225 start_codon:yes stop_codon:yes gene_type:complete
MDLDDQLKLDHLLFSERKCRTCGQVKDLIADFYLSRKNKLSSPSAYSYECKTCTIKRITTSRKRNTIEWEYPDW